MAMVEFIVLEIQKVMIYMLVLQLNRLASECKNIGQA